MKPNCVWNGLLKAAFGSALILAATTSSLRAQDRADRAVALLMKLCVASGGSVTSSKATSNPAGGEFRLESNKGSFTIESREAWGLVQGIDAALSNLTADQANRARDCMRPYISQVLAIIIGAPPSNANPPSGSNPPLVPPQSAAVSRNPRTEGVPIVYYLKPADGSSVTEALKSRGISFTQVAAVLPERVRTNAIFCAPGTPAEAIRELALALTDGGIPVRAIERVRRRDSQTTNALFVISRLGAERNAIISAALSKAQIASITECPDDREGGGISNFARFENPRPTANVNDTRYLDATGGDANATAFCKQRGFFDNVGWKRRQAAGSKVVAKSLADNLICTQDCDVFTLILCE
jgi:hypothetical protein